MIEEEKDSPNMQQSVRAEHKRRRSGQGRAEDLLVFQAAKELIAYTLRIVEKFPKKERFVLVNQAKNAAIEIYAHLLQANETYIDLKMITDMRKTIRALEEQKKTASAAVNLEAHYFRENKLLMLRLNLANKFDERIEKRRGEQNQALVKLKLLLFLAELAFEQRYLSAEQFKSWSALVAKTKNLTAGWISSERKRFQY